MFNKLSKFWKREKRAPVDPLRRRARELFDAGDWDAADQAWRELGDHYPDQGQAASMFRARIAARQGRPGDAIEHYLAVLGRNPESKEALRYIVRQWTAGGEADKVQRLGQQLRKAAPASRNCQIAEALHARLEGRCDEAVSKLRLLIGEEADDELRIHLIDTLKESGRFEDAIAETDRAIAELPDSVWPPRKRKSIVQAAIATATKEGDGDRIRQLVDLVLSELAAVEPDYLVDFASQFIRLERFDLAEKLISAGEAHYDEADAMLPARATMAYKRHDYAKADTMLARLADTQPDYREAAMRYRARIAQTERRYDDAASLYNRVVAEFGEDEEAEEFENWIGRRKENAELRRREAIARRKEEERRHEIARYRSEFSTAADAGDEIELERLSGEVVDALARFDPIHIADLASHCVRLERFDLAEKLIDASEKHYDTPDAVLFARATVAYKRRDYIKADDMLMRLAETQPAHRSAALRYRARIAQAERRYDDAARLYDIIAAEFGKDEETEEFDSWLVERKEGAERRRQEALARREEEERRRELAKFRNSFAAVADKGEMAEAEKLISEAIRSIARFDPLHIVDLASHCVRLGRFDLAEKLIEAGEQHYDTPDAVLFARATVAYKRHDYERADEMLARLAETQPEHRSAALRYRARIAQAERRYGDAAKLYETIVAEFGADDETEEFETWRGQQKEGAEHRRQEAIARREETERRRELATAKGPEKPQETAASRGTEEQDAGKSAEQIVEEALRKRAEKRRRG